MLTPLPAGPLRLALTGAGGYIGGRVLCLLLEDPIVEQVLAVDVRPWRGTVPERCKPITMDINDDRLAQLLGEHRINGVIHLAFILNPIHDEREMYRVNVHGTRRLLAACRHRGILNIVVASSGVVYGAKPEHTEPLTEDHPLDKGNGFSYTAHKIEVEKVCAQYQQEEPSAAVKIIRPSVVIGPNVNNYLSRYLQKRFVFGGRGYDPGMQFVHENDIARVFYTAAKSGVRGCFNACGHGVVLFSELAALFGKRVIPMSVAVLRGMTSAGWRMHLASLTESPPELLDYILHPWLMNNSKIHAEMGFEFQYTTHQAIQSYLDAHPEIRSLPSRS